MSFPNILTDNASVVTSLRDLTMAGDSSARPFAVLTNYNLGNNTLLLQMPMQTFIERSEVANERGLAQSKDYEGYEIAQRKLDPAHAQKLAVYLLKGSISAAIRLRQLEDKPRLEELEEFLKVLGSQPYMAMQPIVANIRTSQLRGDGLQFEKDGGVIKVRLSDRDVLWVVDGQHRRYAMSLVVDFLKEVKDKHRYPKRSKLFPTPHQDELSTRDLHAWMEVYETFRTVCSVAVETHLGLDADMERQLFHDLNNLGKRVEASLAFEYDNSNPVNRFIKEELIIREEEGGFWKPQVVDKDIVDWHGDPGAMSRKDLIAVNAILFLNKTNIKGAQPGDVEEKREVALKLWEEINQIEGFGEPGAKEKTVAAQPVVLKALAKLAYDFGFGRTKDEGHLETLLEGIKRIDFSHTNPMWRYYQLSPEQRDEYQLAGLAEYLPINTEGYNRDIGMFDENSQKMRFGAKHNDIYPIIGDMIRWRLGLPNRNA
jgi:hypothetical protein